MAGAGFTGGRPENPLHACVMAGEVLRYCTVASEDLHYIFSCLLDWLALISPDQSVKSCHYKDCVRNHTDV